MPYKSIQAYKSKQKSGSVLDRLRMDDHNQTISSFKPKKKKKKLYKQRHAKIEWSFAYMILPATEHSIRHLQSSTWIFYRNSEILDHKLI